jgi:hypothetical protein
MEIDGDESLYRQLLAEPLSYPMGRAARASPGNWSIGTTR